MYISIYIIYVYTIFITELNLNNEILVSDINRSKDIMRRLDKLIIKIKNEYEECQKCILLKKTYYSEEIKNEKKKIYKKMKIITDEYIKYKNEVWLPVINAREAFSKIRSENESEIKELKKIIDTEKKNSSKKQYVKEKEYVLEYNRKKESYEPIKQALIKARNEEIEMIKQNRRKRIIELKREFSEFVDTILIKE
ncbi:uncharacterized protein VNE69_09143 [Vairimorpha necatrix]|uniref:Uncharacterized protein n=1 Tax=Vairimorpha necatrix TaxID=6039 RepID=A0AAX4JF03_9MICR